MPKLTLRNDVVQVLTEDQEEWLLLVPDGSVTQVEATDQVLWITQLERIVFYDIPSRRLIGVVSLAGGAKATRLSVDKTRLFLIQTFRGEAGIASELQTIDLKTAEVLAQHRLQGVLAVADIRETADGTLFARRYSSNADDTSILWRIDPRTGAAETAEVKNSTSFQPFERPSPDGRYWLRRDDRLARQVVEERKSGIFGRSKTAYFSPVVQLWEAWPPRFLRWLPVGWTAEDEMPRLDGGWPIQNPEERVRVWASIADASDDAPGDPTVGINWPKPGLRERLAAEAFSRVPRPDPAQRGKVEDEAIVRMVREWHQFVHGDSLRRVPIWDLDGAGFWLEVEQVVRRISVDGTSSMGQYLLHRAGKREVMAPGSEALPRHRLAARFNEGRAILHDVGRGPARPTEIKREGPDWSDRGGANDWDRTLDQRVEKLLEARDRMVVPLEAWSEAGVVAAMRAFGQILVATPPPRNRPRAWVVFAHNGEAISEQQFFERVTVEFPSVAPEIDRLIHVACDALASHYMLLSQDHQVALLGHAARALGVLDIGALPTLQRYYTKMIDSGHETWFALQTVPLIVEHHGWQRPVVEFVWWLLLKRPTNGLDDYASVWLSPVKGRTDKQWGMGQAVRAMYRPEQFAELTSRLIGPPQVEGSHPARYSYHAVDALLAHLSYRHDMKVEMVRESDEWLAKFLDLMATPPASSAA